MPATGHKRAVASGCFQERKFEMRIARCCLAAAIVLGFTFTSALAQSPLQESHIEGNVPTERDFDKFLQRDLLAYFQATVPGTTSVEWTLSGPCCDVLRRNLVSPTPSFMLG
jgi:hypothetical protein